MAISSSSWERGVVERITIDHVGHRGDGVSIDRPPTFVPFTLPGEIVDTDNSDGRYRLVQIEQKSAERIDPFCRYFARCGGCAIQHWQPTPYQAWKRQIVIDTLSQAGIDGTVDPLIDAHGAGRRRVTLHARYKDGQTLVGFAEAASHAIVAIADCPILDPALAGALDAARAVAALLKAMDKPLDIQVTAADNGLDIDVRGSGPISTALISQLSALAAEHRLARLTRHGELVLMRAPPVVTMGKASVALPPGAFLQATAAGEEALAALVLQHCKGAKVIADLFCGIGPFALRLAAKAKIQAIDNDAKAIASLQQAIKATPGLKPITAEARDLFRRPLVAQELRDIDAVVFDPPRAGAQAQAERLAASKVPLVVAVSCNVQSFARDARILIDGGYRLQAVTPVDQFRHTPHIELVARFTR
jgi:23S rRNA (uracil1939-C5)-methyltransferase